MGPGFRRHSQAPHARSDLGWCRECGDCHVLLSYGFSSNVCVRDHMRARNGLTHLMKCFHCQDMLCNSPLSTCCCCCCHIQQSAVCRKERTIAAGRDQFLPFSPPQFMGSADCPGQSGYARHLANSTPFPPSCSPACSLPPPAARCPRQCNPDRFISAQS